MTLTFIGERAAVAIMRMKDSDTRYQETCKSQDEVWERSVDPILRKLETEDRRAVIRYYEGEVHRFSLEFDEVYLQGIKDCLNGLVFLGVLGAEHSQGIGKLFTE